MPSTRLGSLIAGACVLAVLVAAPSPSEGQTSAAAGVSCRLLLTDAEVQAAVGRPGGALESIEHAPGDTRCTWTWTDPDASLAVSVSDAAAITANAPATRCCDRTGVPVVAQFYDHAIRTAVDLGADPPAPLTGMAERAALFFEEGFLKLLVQRANAVAQIVSGGLTREQLLAVGRALSAP